MFHKEYQKVEITTTGSVVNNTRRMATFNTRLGKYHTLRKVIGKSTG
ncbi:hypothetical protein RB213_012830 [Colletotrichum asianum]